MRIKHTFIVKWFYIAITTPFTYRDNDTFPLTGLYLCSISRLST